MASSSSSSPGKVSLVPSDEAAQLSVDEIAERLQSKLPRGISDAEAARRHEEFGFNEFDIGEEESLLANYVRLWFTLRR